MGPYYHDYVLVTTADNLWVHSMGTFALAGQKPLECYTRICLSRVQYEYFLLLGSPPPNVLDIKMGGRGLKSSAHCIA